MILSFLIAAAYTPRTFADDRFGVGIKAGTYGLGADFGVTLNDYVSFRVSFQRLEVSVDESVDDVDYDGDFTLGGEGVYADIYPFGGQFRITGGLFSNRNEVGLEGTPTGSIDIGDNTYTPSQVGTLSGTVTFDSTAPYVGVGWGNTSRGKKRLRFVVDLGILFQGSGQVEDYAASGGGVLQSDLDKEAADIEDEIGDVDFWPILNFGLAFRF